MDKNTNRKLTRKNFDNIRFGWMDPFKDKVLDEFHDVDHYDDRVIDEYKIKSRNYEDY